MNIMGQKPTKRNTAGKTGAQPKRVTPARPLMRGTLENARAKTTRAATAKPTGRRTKLPPIAVLALFVVALIFCGALVAFLTNGFGSWNKVRSYDLSQLDENETYVSPYNFAGLSFNNKKRPEYRVDGQLMSTLGIDVSEHQETIDWQAVKNDDISFAFVRIGNRGYTEGGLFADQNAQTNIDGAQKTGLEVGVYFYSQATSVEEAQEEADFVIQQLTGHKLELPVVFDHEINPEPTARGNDVDSDTLTAAAQAFCERIEAAGYDSMLYGNQYDMERFSLAAVSGSFGDNTYAKAGNSSTARPVWLAEYDVSKPTAQFDFIIWQYTNSGSVAGISGNVDMNIRFRLA